MTTRLAVPLSLAAAFMLCAAGAQGAVNHKHTPTSSTLGKDPSRFMSMQEGSGSKTGHHGKKHHGTSRTGAKHSKHSTSNLAHNGKSGKGHHKKSTPDVGATHV